MSLSLSSHGVKNVNADRWEQIHKAKDWGTYPDNHLVRFVMRNRDQLGKSALDVGCGIGAQTMFLFEQGFDEVVGIDLSPTAIAKARVYSGAATYEVGNALHINEDDNSFDFVSDVCCLQHILAPDHHKAFSEVHRVLKPGGYFFSLTAKWDHSPSLDTPLRTMRRHEMDEYNSAGLRTETVDQSNVSQYGGAFWACHWIVVARKKQNEEQISPA